MREDDLLKFVWVADPQISPDGSRIAFTRVSVDVEADEYVTALWIADTAGGEARPLTFGRQDSQPRWSPDGRSLVFVRGTEPKKPCQLHVLSMEGGESRKLTSLEKGASEPAWSPDGRRIAFLSGTNPELDAPEANKPKNEPGRVVTRPVFRENGEGFLDFDHLDHVWVIDAGGGEPRRLTVGRQKDASPGWSRDGRHVLLLSDRREEPWFGPEDATLYAVSPDRDAPADTKDLTEVADVVGPISAFAEDSAGRIAAVVAFAQDPPRTYDQHDLVLFEGEWPRRSPRVLLEGQDLEVGEGITSDQHPPRGGGAMPLAFTADERGVLCVITRRGAARLAIVARGGSLTWCTDERHEVVAGSVTPDGRKVALVIGDPRTPGELCVYDVAKGSLTRLFAPNEALLTGARLGEVEEIDYPSFDGRAIHGWIVKPPDFDPSKRYPLILEIHGGPHSAYGVAFFHEFQVLAEAGYVVLYTNPRGSTSYGQSFADCIQYCYPGDDAKDLLAGVDALIARGYVDETRMGVTGGSGGGLLTNWVVANTDRFRAAITQRCVSEWMSFWYSCDFALFPPFWFRKPPFENPQEYLDRSPVTFASRITTPLMVIHSEEDWRTPIGQGEAMFRALKHQRKPTVMVRFPGENHELSRSGTPSRRVQNQEHIRRWFDHWLRDVPAPQYEV